MTNTITKKYIALIGLLASVALLGASACSSSDNKDNEMSSSSSSESSSATASEKDPEVTSEEPQQETSAQASDEGAEETSEEAGQARETLLDIIASSLPFENEAFVICIVDTTRENFGGPYQRLLDDLISDVGTPKIDKAADDALQSCQSELSTNELQLLGELAEAAEEDEVAEEQVAAEEDSQEPTQGGGSNANGGSSGPPPPTVGSCSTTIGVDYVPFYEFSQHPDVVMVGYGDVLNLYEQPDVSSSVILTIPALDETITYEGYSRSIQTNAWPYTTWHCMTYNGFHGWVPGFYVSMLASSSAAWSGYGLIGLERSDLEGFEQDVQTIFGGACPEYAGVGTQIVLSDLQTRLTGGDVTFDIRGWCDDAASGIRLTLTAQKQISRLERYEIVSAEIRPLCIRGVSGQNCS
mgnify:CR=1 FL=1